MATILSQLCECNRSAEVTLLGLLWYPLYTSTLTGCIPMCNIILFLKREILAKDSGKVLIYFLILLSDNFFFIFLYFLLLLVLSLLSIYLCFPKTLPSFISHLLNKAPPLATCT